MVRIVLRLGSGVRLWILPCGFMAFSWVATASVGFAQSQLRRDTPVQPVALVKKGDLLLGAGAGYESDVRVPLLALDGDLTRVMVHLVYGLADGVLVEIRGDAYRALTVDRMGTPLVEPDEGVTGGTSTGAGDFLARLLFTLFGDDRGFAGGARLEFNIPSSKEREGLGTNSINVRASLLGTYGRGPFRITADFGLAILEAPLENFKQNDVVVYSAELLYRLPRRRSLRLFAGLDGRASTRGTVPVGTEDLGEVSFGADYLVGSLLLDAAGHVGYAGISPDWGVTGGVSLLLRR